MHKDLFDFISRAMAEDIGDGDHTSLACIPDLEMGKMHLLVKQNGILAGVEIAKCICELVDSNIIFRGILFDSSSITKGDIAFEISGLVQSMLKAERLILNVMQRMSGIATNTQMYVNLLRDTKCRVLDTRKTTPLNRFLEKEAVRIGGGMNHRFGLYDMIMIKDNHVDFAGGIQSAVQRTVDYLERTGKSLKIELEVRNFDELSQALSLDRIDRIMLDNFSVEDTYKAVKLVNGRKEIESSGGIDFNTIRAYALTGVDYISVGALTHQISSLDLSLKAF